MVCLLSSLGNFVFDGVMVRLLVYIDGVMVCILSVV